ncbi:VOC family protein [Nocardioides sp.]|uniref:VOC family protein n=1 Tax=Nocardioides sp. TaxID=35761 RepID=UPI00378327E7
MSTYLCPYLNFRGEAREAMTFYQSVFGGTLEVMTFADMGGMGVADDETHLVMHSALTVSESVLLMGADVPRHMEGDFPSGGLALSGDDVDTLRRWFDGLQEGGTVDVPLEKAPWGDWFGQVTDKHGVSWMVNASGSPAAG